MRRARACTSPDEFQARHLKASLRSQNLGTRLEQITTAACVLGLCALEIWESWLWLCFVFATAWLCLPLCLLQLLSACLHICLPLCLPLCLLPVFLFLLPRCMPTTNYLRCISATASPAAGAVGAMPPIGGYDFMDMRSAVRKYPSPRGISHKSGLWSLGSRIDRAAFSALRSEPLLKVLKAWSQCWNEHDHALHVA